MEMMKIMLHTVFAKNARNQKSTIELSWTIEYYNIPKFYKIMLKNKNFLYITLVILFVITNCS